LAQIFKREARGKFGCQTFTQHFQKVLGPRKSNLTPFGDFRENFNNFGMILFINTLSNKKIFLALFNPVKSSVKSGGATKKQERLGLLSTGVYHSTKLLPCLDKFFKKNKNKIKNLKGVIAVNGPGSFTRLRTCLTTLNVLSYFLNIKSVGIKADSRFSNQDLIKRGLKLIRQKKIAPLKPFYGQEPNITISSKNKKIK